jgi:hypothetical protein
VDAEEGLVRGQSTMDGDHACTRLVPDFWSVRTHHIEPRSGRLIAPGDKADIIVGISTIIAFPMDAKGLAARETCRFMVFSMWKMNDMHKADNGT